jgi:hypothetical protein
MRYRLLGVAATVGLALATPAGAAVREIQFKNPSGNARCVAAQVSGKRPWVACAILSTGTAGLDPQAWWLYPRGPIGPPIRTDNWIGPDVPVLRYGRARRFFGVLRCRSLTVGMLCWSTASGHGFLLSRTHQLVF